MTKHLVGRDATLSVLVAGEWVNVGTVGHLDYPKACADLLQGGAFLDSPSRRESIPVVAEQCDIYEKQKPTKNNKLFDRWGRLK